MIVDRSVVPATQKPREGFPFWWRFYWWIYGGFAGTVMIGMFFWLRKPRVEVIESHYSMADDGLTGTVGTDFGPSGRTSNKPSPGQRSVQPSGSRQVSREKPVLDELTPLLQELQDAGFNGNYEKLLRLYYEEGLTEDEIIERTARGRGEVGLVLDYVERLRKG